MSSTPYDIHNQLLQFDAHRVNYKDSPHKGTRYRLQFSNTRNESKHGVKSQTKASSKPNQKTTMTFTLLPVQTSKKVTTAKNALIRTLQATPFPTRKVTHSDSPKLPATIIISHGTPANTTQHGLYQTLINYMNVFAPGVFDSSKKSIYNTCSITKGIQRSWLMEKETGHMAFTTVGTYTGGDFLIKNDMKIKPGTQEAIDALRKSGNLPKVSTKSKYAYIVRLALHRFPSFTANVVEHLLPVGTRPAFCRLLREQSGVLAIQDDDKPSVAVKKMLDDQKVKKETQLSLKTSKKTKKTKKQKLRFGLKDSEIILLEIFAILSFTGYRIVDKDLEKAKKEIRIRTIKYDKLFKQHKYNARRLQLLVGGAITSFAQQFIDSNCTIHSLNNATYWYRLEKGIKKQIGSIDIDLAIERFYAYIEGSNDSQDITTGIDDGFRLPDCEPRIKHHDHPHSLHDGGYPLFISRLYLIKMGLNAALIASEKQFKERIKDVWTKSFVAIIICFICYSKTKRTGGHVVSLRREPPSHNQSSLPVSNDRSVESNWLYQDSNLVLNQELIADATPQILWDFMQKTRYYSNHARLEYSICIITWSD